MSELPEALAPALEAIRLIELSERAHAVFGPEGSVPDAVFLARLESAIAEKLDALDGAERHGETASDKSRAAQ